MATIDEYHASHKALAEAVRASNDSELVASWIASHSGTRVLDEAQRRGLTAKNVAQLKREIVGGMLHIKAEAMNRGLALPSFDETSMPRSK